jgi:hypothetical protein
MARSPFFLFAIIVTVAVAFVMVVGQMNAHTPTEGVYGMANQSANQTGQLIYQTSNMAPAWVMPGILVAMAVLLISVFAMLKFRKR